MVSFKKSQNYSHASLLEEDNYYEPSPILIVGTSGSGKSVAMEEAVEQIEDNQKNTISIFLYDATDEFEAGFAMLPATDKRHLDKLKHQFEEPAGKDNVVLWYIYGSRLKKWIKHNRRAPKGNIITFSGQDVFKSEECQFILESKSITSSVQVLMGSAQKLKKYEDSRFLRYHIKKKTIQNKDEFEESGDAKDYNKILRNFKILEQEQNIMADDFYLNFDVNKLFKEPNKRHVFIYAGLDQDPKVRHFYFFHILNQISRNIGLCKYPVVLVMEEAQDLAPDKGDGHVEVLSAKTSKIIGEIRKTGRGVSFFVLGTVWNIISGDIRAQCGDSFLFKLAKDDRKDYFKTRGIGKSEKNNMIYLKKGECVLEGYENRIIQVKMPRHGHKLKHLNFLEEFNKYFPHNQSDFKEEIKAIDDEQKKQKKNYENLLKDYSLKKKKEKLKKQRQKGLGNVTKVKELEGQIKEQRKEEKEKRNQAIIEAEKELIENKNKKASYRNVMDLVNSKGFSVSKGTVQNVLTEYHSTQGKNGEKSENE